MSDVISGVPRELLERLCSGYPSRDRADARDQLRALLTAQPQPSAAQSAPAGEREAMDAAFHSSGLTKFKDTYAAGWEARAAWQRTQSAGVPDALREAVEYLDDNPFNEIGAGSILHRAMRDALAAAPAQPAAQEQHPDDEAVDRFAAAMKAKLAKSREKGRHGWQTASAAHLSGLLYRHMYKADPLDVANLAMMLHQNGQAIELPQEARHDQGEVQRLREALERATKLLSAAAGYATKMEPMPAKLLNAIDAELDASTGQEV